MPANALTKRLSKAIDICSIVVITIVGSIPWLLFNQKIELAIIAPFSLFIVFFVHDRYQQRDSKNKNVLFIAVLVSVQVVLIRYGVIPEGSANHRLLFRTLLVSVLPIIFFVTQSKKVRNVIAVNILILFIGLMVIEGTLTVLSPKRSEQNRWSDLASQFDESPVPETNPVISMDGQHRVTTGQPKDFKKRLFFYGGSTTFNREVSDQDTFPSQTQNLLNQANLMVRVENRGTIGASAVDLLRFLQANESELVNSYKGDTRRGLRRGDIVVFYIGVNEAKNAIVYRDPITRLSLRFPTFEATSNWIFKHTNVGYAINNLLAIGQASINEENLVETKQSLETARTFVTDRGGIFIAVIQPHVFTRSNPLPYEKEIRNSMGEFPNAVESIYPRLAEIVLSVENSADARQAFDQLSTSPFFDWCHVNKLGNKYVAEFMSKVVRQYLN
jgi:hypothetical protein